MSRNKEQGYKEMPGKRFSFSKRKTGVSLAALAAAEAMFVILLQMEKNILSQYEKGEIYVAAQTITKGQMITEENYQEFFRLSEMDKLLIPDTALTNPDQIQGLAATFEVEPGTLLTKGMFEGVNDIWNGMEEPVIAGFRAEDIYQVAGGTLRAGDRVHIYIVKEGETILAWERVYVQQVFDASGANIPNTDHVTAAQRVNIYLDKREVAAFYTGIEEGSVRVVRLCQS